MFVSITPSGDTPTFWSFYHSISDIARVKKFINGLIAEVMDPVNEFYEIYMNYEKLLLTDKVRYIDAYVNDGDNLPFWKSPASGASSEVEYDEKQSNSHRLQFDKLNTVHEVISTWQTKALCRGWLIVNSSKLKQDLLQHISEWTKLLMMKLEMYVDERLRQYSEFFGEALLELDEKIDLGDFEKLKRVLQTQKKIAKERAKEDDDVLFKPLIDIVNLLKSMNIPIDENILQMVRKEELYKSVMD